VRWLVAVAVTLLVTLAGGCVTDELVACSDGRLCPRGTACDLVHQSCVAPDQLSACDGLDDFASCEATGVELGRCFGGVCLPAGCGNGELEPDELCDDGNVVPGDGCSADCLSREVCGDGYTDVSRGEECDDGNTRAHDGCTNACTRERPLWRTHLQDLPAPRQDASGTYDPIHGELVVFGGEDGAKQILDDTWALDEVGWSSLALGAPIRRERAGIAYDPVRHAVVMFGGYSASAQGILLNDTWQWSGAVWTRSTPASVPPARMRPGMAWDGARVILFGGSQIGSLLDDTWAWDGSDWTRLVTTHAPPPREGQAMAFDPKHARVVLFGGLAPTPFDDTWVFDGTDWSQLVTTGSPPRLAWGALAYDPVREVVVLSGVEAGTNANVVWELDGSEWIDRAPDVTPGITGGAVVAYDERRGRVVQIGGKKITTNLLSGEIWEWTGSDWMLAPAPAIPERRQLCGLASDPLRGQVVLFGGQGSTLPLGDAWEWNGRSWRRFLGAGPPPRVAPALVYDGAAREVLLFGGAGADVYGDTWHFDGARWLEVATVGPAPRYGAALAYDIARARVVLFGGSNGTQYFGDTWEWDGSTWTELAPTTSPGARANAQLAYDAARARVVLFGGLASDGATELADTWEWDGTAWAERTSPLVPEGRHAAGLAYDRNRRRVTLFGGASSGFSLWEWDGEQWTQPETALVPIALNNACATYDDARAEIIAFGGDYGGLQQQTATGSYRGELEEVCAAGIDLDGDAAAGCDDDDCRTVCAPACGDDPACTQAPRCGDGTCSNLESEAGAACAADCP
jgi:cysteine-rich repeat protein